MKERVVNIKELVKNKEQAKGFFASRGYATIKRSFINEQGEQETEIIRIPIKPIGDHPLLKEFRKKFPPPKPPAKRMLINTKTGQTPDEAGVTLAELKADPNWQWHTVYDETDEEYRKQLDEWTRKFYIVQIMIVFDLEDEFGLDKLDEFEQFIEDLGFSANQLANIVEDIKNLDFLPKETKSVR